MPMEIVTLKGPRNSGRVTSLRAQTSVPEGLGARLESHMTMQEYTKQLTHLHL